MKYLLGVLGVVVLTVVVIVLMVSGGSGSQTPTTATSTKLVDYDTSTSSVTFTIDGPIVGDQDHQAVRISVSQDKNVLQILKGYNLNVASVKTYRNTEKGYQAFLAALDSYGFRSVRPSSLDSRGACATGDRYRYQLNDGTKDVVDTWGTSCSTKQGTFSGNAMNVRQLFQAQITDYNELTSQVNL